MRGWTIVDPARVAPAAWKNGGGVTRELVAWPTAGDWRVRVSIADVERDGPFSPYPGVQRWFAVLEGEGVKLRMGSCEHVLDAQSPPFEFAGSVPVDCNLVAGATRDFNLMVKGGDGTMQRLSGDVRRDGGSWTGVYAVSAARLGDVELAAGRFAWRVVGADENVHASGAGMLWMEVK